MINWFSQIASVTWFGLCTIPRRKGSAIAAIFGIAGVVAVFVGVLSIAQGFRRAVTSTGRDDIAIVLRDGAKNEMSSGLGRDAARIIKDAPGVARDNQGAVASAELFVIIDVPKGQRHRRQRSLSRSRSRRRNSARRREGYPRAHV